MRPVVGLTGGSGAGKSTAAEVLASFGAHVVSADAANRAIVSPYWPTPDGFRQPRPLVRIRESWPKAFRGDGSLDRKALGEIVFRSARQRMWLEEILEPAFRVEIQRRLELAPRGCPYVLLDDALLFRARNDGYCEAVVIVEAPFDVRMARVLAREPGLSEEAARGRLLANPPQPTSGEISRFAKHGFFLRVRNDMSRELLTAELAVAHAELCRRLPG